MKTTHLVTLYSMGWTISYRSPQCGHLLSPHEGGNVSILSPFLGMHGWKSSYVLDYKTADRLNPIDAFFSSITWDRLDKRLVV